jgi:flavin-dependent dehydrogenase
MTATAERRTGVAIVGGGPAGAALAIRLARRRIEATVFERTIEPRWRACGVYSSPLTRSWLLELGLDAARIETLVTRVPGLGIQTVDLTSPSATARLAYEGYGGACGIDRLAVDHELLLLAERSGAQVRRGATVRAIDVQGRDARFGSVGLTVSTPSGPEAWRARLVVGADGPGSLVARAFRVQRQSRWLRRAGITFHVPALPGFGEDARMVIGDGWYCGLCPVPGNRLNVGIVITEQRLRSALHRGHRPEPLAREVLARIPSFGSALESMPVLDSVCVALPLANGVSRRAGPGFLLVGDACGFIDPISGEGFARALRSAAWATDAIAKHLERSNNKRSNHTSLAVYDRHLHHRFGRKDVVSWLIQAFLARRSALDYAVRRLEGRPHLRETFSLVMADLAAPERALDPRFLAALLRP